MVLRLSGKCLRSCAHTLLLQVDLMLLIPLRIIMGSSFATLYTSVGGFSYPWLQAMGTQLLSYCVSVGIDMRYRSIYKRRGAKEVALAAEVATAEAGKASAKL